MKAVCSFFNCKFDFVVLSVKCFIYHLFLSLPKIANMASVYRKYNIGKQMDLSTKFFFLNVLKRNLQLLMLKKK